MLHRDAVLIAMGYSCSPTSALRLNIQAQYFLGRVVGGPDFKPAAKKHGVADPVAVDFQELGVALIIARPARGRSGKVAIGISRSYSA